MKKNKTSFTEQEIILLKQHYNLADIARKYGFNPEHRRIYRIMRSFPKTKGCKAYLVQQDLEKKLEIINSSTLEE